MNEEMEELFGSNDVMEKSLSYSRISDFDRNGCRALTERTFVGGDGVKIGGLTDDLITDYVTKSNILKENYFIFNGDKPTAMLGKLADIILDNYKKIPSKKEILKIINDNNFWTNIKNPDILISKIYDSDLLSYLNAMYISKEKTLITTKELMLAEELRDTIIMHNNTKFLFDNKFELVVQKKFEFIYKNFKLRGILDFILIDHKKKEVEFIDLKTGKNSLLDFKTSYIKWRYYLQECIYKKAFEQIMIDLNLKGYSLKTFKFLYIGRYEKIPFLFEIPSKWSEAALKGFTTMQGFTYRGLDELLEEIRWHLTNRIFDLPREIYESNGAMILDDSFIKLK